MKDEAEPTQLERTYLKLIELQTARITQLVDVLKKAGLAVPLFDGETVEVAKRLL